MAEKEKTGSEMEFLLAKFADNMAKSDDIGERILHRAYSGGTEQLARCVGELRLYMEFRELRAAGIMGELVIDRLMTYGNLVADDIAVCVTKFADMQLLEPAKVINLRHEQAEADDAA